jgi:APA family basic amino acid/polyamine antiporter
VTGHYQKVRAGRPGRLIVNEAREMSAKVIVMALPPRTGTSVFGKTVETVLAERPCRVIVQHDPNAVAVRRGPTSAWAPADVADPGSSSGARPRCCRR